MVQRSSATMMLRDSTWSVACTACSSCCLLCSSAFQNASRSARAVAAAPSMASSACASRVRASSRSACKGVRPLGVRPQLEALHSTELQLDMLEDVC